MTWSNISIVPRLRKPVLDKQNKASVLVKQKLTMVTQVEKLQPQEAKKMAMGFQSLPFCWFQHKGLLLEKTTKSYTIMTKSCVTKGFPSHSGGFCVIRPTIPAHPKRLHVEIRPCQSEGQGSGTRFVLFTCLLPLYQLHPLCSHKLNSSRESCISASNIPLS